MFELVVEQESWDSFWPDADALARKHWEEVDRGVDDRREYGPQADVMRQLWEHKILRCWSARRAGRLVGYLTWNILPDIESFGTLCAMQGAWFASPDAPKGTGHRLFKKSLEDLKALDVQYVFPHHRLQGRGKAIGHYFEKLGAKKIQDSYMLWIGDKNA